MNTDYNPPKATQNRPSKARRHTPLIIITFISLLAAFYFGSQPNPHQTKVATAIEEPAVPEIPPAPVIPEIKREIIPGQVQSGDTISSLLGAHFGPGEIHTLAKESNPVFPLSKICAGQPYRICLEDGEFERFEYDIDRDDQLIIQKEDEGFDIQRIPIAYDIQIELVQGTITSNLFQTVAEINEDPRLALKLFDIFAWDIDFIRDIRGNDSFKVLIEKRFREGKSAGYGKLLAAEFTNQGQTYRAFLYKDGNRQEDYYDETGKSLRKAFLKAPLAYTRISSGYTKRRFHPVLNKWKPHLAIDYAAPTGTPIKSVADGTIIRKSYDRNNGNLIRIRHPQNYETTYIHMSRFAKGMKKGVRVRQGQIIGYVGSTGIATGPHLDFRVFKNGKPINPLKIKSTPASPVSKDNKSDFLALADRLTSRLTEPAIFTAELRPKEKSKTP